jgi:hypothetical protein
MKLKRTIAAVAASSGLTLAALVALAPPAGAVTGTQASCLGQFFSSHAGLGAAHTGETVGSITSAAAHEFGGVGPLFSEARFLDRADCGL